MLEQKHFEPKQNSLFYTNIDKAEIFHVVHGKVALLTRKRSEHGTRDCGQKPSIYLPDVETKLATTPKVHSSNFEKFIWEKTVQRHL